MFPDPSIASATVGGLPYKVVRLSLSVSTEGGGSYSSCSVSVVTLSRCAALPERPFRTTNATTAATRTTPATLSETATGTSHAGDSSESAACELEAASDVVVVDVCASVVAGVVVLVFVVVVVVRDSVVVSVVLEAQTHVPEVPEHRPTHSPSMQFSPRDLNMATHLPNSHLGP